MYQETGDEEYLKKAKRFCNFVCDYGKHQCRTLDRPFTLFEGMNGTVYFLDDMEKNVEDARFLVFISRVGGIFSKLELQNQNPL